MIFLICKRNLRFLYLNGRNSLQFIILLVRQREKVALSATIYKAFSHFLVLLKFLLNVQSRIFMYMVWLCKLNGLSIQLYVYGTRKYTHAILN